MALHTLVLGVKYAKNNMKMIMHVVFMKCLNHDANNLLPFDAKMHVHGIDFYSFLSFLFFSFPVRFKISALDLSSFGLSCIGIFDSSSIHIDHSSFSQKISSHHFFVWANVFFCHFCSRKLDIFSNFPSFIIIMHLYAYLSSSLINQDFKGQFKNA